MQRVVVVGPGRVGRSLARALPRSGQIVVLLGRRHESDVAVDWSRHLADADLIVIAVPDDAIAVVADRLKESGAITAGSVVLHTSGRHDRTALASLAGIGAALGSFHPLQSFARSDGDPDSFRGAPAVIEGDERALAAARELAALLGADPVVEVASGQKALYHAGAVFASNYLVVLAHVAVRLAQQAGADGADISLFLPIMHRTMDNLAQMTSAARHSALTGPIRRGDVGTVAAHLAALDEPERTLYRDLGKEALAMARDAGLDPARAAELQQLLDY